MSGPETLLAFDFGLRRTGVAVGNSVTRTARPLAVIEAPSEARRFEAIGALIAQWAPQRLVVGVPREPDDGAGCSADADSGAGTGAGAGAGAGTDADASIGAGAGAGTRTRAGGKPARAGAGLLMTGRCERFARQLAGRYGLPVVTVDERFSSRAAAADAGRGPDDAHAAALILEQWFHDGA